MSLEKLSTLTRQLRDLKREKDEAEAALKEINKKYDQLRKITIPEVMEATDPDLSKLSIKGIGTLYLKTDLYAGIKDKEAAFEWLRENGYSDLIGETINGSTLRAWMKEQLEEGTELPDVFRCDPYRVAVLVK